MKLFRFLPAVAAMAVASLLGVAVASAFVGQGPKDDVDLAPAKLRPKPETARIAATARDHTGLGWGVRLSESRDGSTCLDVGRVEDGRFGRPRIAEFRERSASHDISQSCGPAIGSSPYYVRFEALAFPDRLLILGQADDAVAELSVATPDGPATVQPDGDGAFLVALDGAREDLESHPVTVRLADGTEFVHEWGGAKPLPRKPGR